MPISSVRALAEKHAQLIRYGLIGVTGAALDFMLYIVFYRYCSIPPVLASFLSVSFGILNNFILNVKFNFKTHDHLLFRFANFYVIGLGGALLSSLLILVLFNGLGLGENIAKLITIPPVVLAQFFLNRRFAFKSLADAPLRAVNLKAKLRWIARHVTLR
ncbi:MAG TPA: GtrA family protein [Candidatus Saccharimonadales bacterium]|nr:GtrA family protein [Candidatus Saccharimonadales bacterium]